VSVSEPPAVRPTWVTAYAATTAINATVQGHLRMNRPGGRLHLKMAVRFRRGVVNLAAVQTGTGLRPAGLTQPRRSSVDARRATTVRTWTHTRGCKLAKRPDVTDPPRSPLLSHACLRLAFVAQTSDEHRPQCALHEAVDLQSQHSHAAGSEATSISTSPSRTFQPPAQRPG
jgi:hypothetical protein